MKRTWILTLAAIVAAASSAAAQGPKPPPPLPMGPVAFPAFAERTLSNGAQVIVVENHEQPVVAVNIFMKGAGQTADPNAKPGVANLTATLLDAGTATRTSKQIAETIEGVGANIFTNASLDWATIGATMLKTDVDVVLGVIADMLLNATYPEDEVETARKRALTDLQVALSRPATLAQRQFEAQVFGPHPYGRQTTTAALRSITREDLTSFHKTYYKPGNALIVVAGDVNPAEITAKLQQHLGAWTGTGPARPKFAAAPALTAREIVLVNKPGSVQAAFRIGHTIVPATHPDWPAIVVAGYILGGGSKGWLFDNLREKKGYTYGAYANAAQRLDPGSFQMFGDVRNEVADSAFEMFVALAEKLEKEPVPAADLDLAKAWLTGNFPLTIETPTQIASQIAQARLLGQPKDHVQTWRQRIAAVTAADVQRVARTHFHPDKAVVVVSGDASVLKPKLERVGKVTVVDEDGKPVVADAPKAVPTGLDASGLPAMTLQYVVLAQGNPIGELTRTVARETVKGKDVIRTRGTMTGMQNMNAELVFEAKSFAPISSNMMVQAGGQEMTQTMTVADGKITGMVKMPQTPEPKMVDANLEAGTVLPGMDEFAIWLHDWSSSKELSINAFNANTGTVIPVKFKLTGESKIKVTAGEFDVYELDMTTTQGTMKGYVRKAAPHILIKQEFAAAPIVVELKSVQ